MKEMLKKIQDNYLHCEKNAVGITIDDTFYTLAFSKFIPHKSLIIFTISNDIEDSFHITAHIDVKSGFKSVGKPHTSNNQSCKNVSVAYNNAILQFETAVLHFISSSNISELAGFDKHKIESEQATPYNDESKKFTGYDELYNLAQVMMTESHHSTDNSIMKLEIACADKETGSKTTALIVAENSDLYLITGIETDPECDQHINHYYIENNKFLKYGKTNSSDIALKLTGIAFK